MLNKTDLNIALDTAKTQLAEHAKTVISDYEEYLEKLKKNNINLESLGFAQNERDKSISLIKKFILVNYPQNEVLVSGGFGNPSANNALHFNLLTELITINKKCEEVYQEFHLHFFPDIKLRTAH